MLLLSLTPLFISFSKFIISGDKDEWGDVLCFVPFSNKASSHPGIALSGISPCHFLLENHSIPGRLLGTL